MSLLLAAWIGTWAAAPQPFMPKALATFSNQTVRLVVHTSIGGTRLRIRVSNTYGDRPLHIGSAHMARRTAGAEIESGSDRAVTFAGTGSATVAPGATAVSDAVELAVAPLADLAVSLWFPDETPAKTNHLLALQTSYVAKGDSTGAAFAVSRTIRSWPFLTGVEVESLAGAAAIVALGDSSIDGDGSTPGANHRWTDFLASRLQRTAAGRFGVLNEGIIGNRLLRDSPRASEFGGALGDAGLARLGRDALDQPGVKFVLVRFGVNDLGLPGTVAPASEAVTAAELIEGLRKLAASVRRRGMHVVSATLPPFESATLAPGYYTPAKEAVRQEVNAWLRGSRDFDGMVDLDRILRDPDHPARLLPAYDSGDHLHANDAGYAAAADAVPLSLFGIR